MTAPDTHPRHAAPLWLLERTLGTPAENLALDEALLRACEEEGGPETLRFWESPSRFVALGRSRRVDEDVDIGACRADGVPVLRRVSGGGTVLQGPGCLSYALVLRLDRDRELADVTRTNRWILERHASAVGSVTGRAVSLRGTSDLAVGDRKVSGNAQRRTRRAVLVHGTFLLDLDAAAVARYLPTPGDQPDYRAGRSHAEFLTTLPVPGERLRQALARAWEADRTLESWPAARVERLVATRYSLASWNLDGRERVPVADAGYNRPRR